jgi:hypothetical protein
MQYKTFGGFADPAKNEESKKAAILHAKATGMNVIESKTPFGTIYEMIKVGFQPREMKDSVRTLIIVTK